MATDCTDNELLDAFAATGEQQFFTTLAERYSPMLLKAARNITKDVNLAEDVVQATLLTLCTKHEKFDRRLALGPWLKTVTVHHAIDLMRARETSFAHSFQDTAQDSDGEGGFDPQDIRLPEPAEAAEAHELADRLQSVLHTIPLNDQNVVRAVYFEGLTAIQAAEKLGMPSGSVRKALHRALCLMKIRLARSDRGDMSAAAA